MARETQRRKTVREAAPLNGARPVQLQEQRRFFQARGNDRGVREARALADAFGAGAELKNTLDVKDNLEGREQAIESAGSGGARDVDNSNDGYNAVWDRLDDERTLNAAKLELPEILRQMDAENQPEEVVQAAISDYMKEQVDGIDMENEDHTWLARGFLSLETGLIEQHRTGVLSKIKQGQLSETYEAELENYKETGEVRYDVLMERTNTFAEREEKKTAYWEMIFDLAINNGDPSIITNAPERFDNGDLTAKNIDAWLDEKRAAISAAMTKAAANQKAADDAVEAEQDDLRFNTQMEIYRRGQKGLDVSDLILTLQGIPGTKFTDVSASKGFADSQFDQNEQFSPSYASIGSLYAGIHARVGNPSDQMADVFAAATAGELGSGETGVENMNALIGKINQYVTNGTSLTNQAATLWRTSLNTRYNDETGGLLSGINPLMQRVKIDANDMYNDLVLGGTNPREALNNVIEEFDPIVANFPQVEEKEITNRRAQSDFTGSRVQISDIEFAIEKQDVTKFRGMPRYALENRLGEMLEAGEISEDELNAFGAIYTQ